MDPSSKYCFVKLPVGSSVYHALINLLKKKNIDYTTDFSFSPAEEGGGIEVIGVNVSIKDLDASKECLNEAYELIESIKIPSKKFKRISYILFFIAIFLMIVIMIYSNSH